MQGLEVVSSKYNSSFTFSGNPEFQKKPSADFTQGSSRVSVPRLDNRLAAATDSMRMMKNLHTRSGTNKSDLLLQMNRKNSVSINHLPSSKVVLWNRFLLADRRKPVKADHSSSSQQSDILVYEPVSPTRASLGPCSAEVTEKRESSRKIFKPPGDNGEHSPGAEHRNQLFESKASGRSEYMSKATMEGMMSTYSAAVASPQPIPLKASAFRRNSGQLEQGLRLVSCPVSKKSQFNQKSGTERI